MKDLSANPKRDDILMAAWQAFATYGFRKTSMDDIARGSGMSRPAVYLHFKGKEEIFRSLVSQYYETAIGDVTTALAQPGTPAQVLSRAFEAQIGKTLEAMLTSAHGMELLDASNTKADDLIMQGEARLTEVYANWLRAAGARGEILLPATPQLLASTICASLKAVKHGGPDYETALAQIRLLALMIGDGLTPR